MYELFITSKRKLYKNTITSAEKKRTILELIYNIDQKFMTLKAAINYFNNDCSWNDSDAY